MWSSVKCMPSFLNQDGSEYKVREMDKAARSLLRNMGIPLKALGYVEKVSLGTVFGDECMWSRAARLFSVMVNSKNPHISPRAMFSIKEPDDVARKDTMWVYMAHDKPFCSLWLSSYVDGTTSLNNIIKNGTVVIREAAGAQDDHNVIDDILISGRLDHVLPCLSFNEPVLPEV